MCVCVVVVVVVVCMCVHMHKTGLQFLKFLCIDYASMERDVDVNCNANLLSALECWMSHDYEKAIAL